MTKSKIQISGIIIAKNEEKMIEDCLRSLGWVDEIILVDSGSTDGSIRMAEKHRAKVVKVIGGNFSDWRNKGAKEAKGKWLLYVDADERITPELREEIESRITNYELRIMAFVIPRKNIFLGQVMKHGGWWPDYVLRLIKKEALIGWKGELHEQAQVKGEIGKLKAPLTHISHRTLTEMVDKTNAWSEIEARLLFEAGHPKMEWWRFFSVAAREFWARGIKEAGFLDGPVGIIEIIYQAFSRMITYAKLWEMQLKTEKHKELKN